MPAIYIILRIATDVSIRPQYLVSATTAPAKAHQFSMAFADGHYSIRSLRHDPTNKLFRVCVEAEQLDEQVHVSFDMLTFDKNKADRKLREEKYGGLSDGVWIDERYIGHSYDSSKFVFYTHLCMEVDGDGREICVKVAESAYPFD
mgnify:CR=1 FL=1|tara:strand:+ start:15788 stop:16225 length:438 start_codon:yes stop_codon:yes gene_type:complete